MSKSLWDESGVMLVSAAIVAAIAVPVGVLCGWYLKSRGQPLFAKWSQPAVPRFGQHISTESADFLFVLIACVLFLSFPVLVSIAASIFQACGIPSEVAIDSSTTPDLETQGNKRIDRIRQMCGTIPVAFVMVLIWLGIRKLGQCPVTRVSLTGFARSFFIGVLTWLIAAPLVYSVHFLSTLFMNELGQKPEQHPLSQLGIGDSVLTQVLFGSVVCVFTPIIEEILFRGLFVGWACGRWYRPWVIMMLAAGLTLMSRTDSPGQWAPLTFIAILGIGLYVLQKMSRVFRNRHTRFSCAIFSCAAFFAAAHSAVWPSPIPLFVLALFLGYLVVRTNGIVSCVIVHGLFNAISYVYLLRGGSG